MEGTDAVRAVYNAIDEKHGKDTTVLDINKVSIIADYFVITSAGSPPQMRAIAEACEDALVGFGVALKHREGFANSAWYLLDFGFIVVHIFNHNDRDFYDLRRIWADAPTLEF
ncbi:ribosomal silencing factor RsfS [Clostridia bacterium]|nr:ribosomal silencing factor RsfS [Clostridia bacterium]